MTPMQKGFAGELVKLAAQAQNQQTEGATPAQGIGTALDRSSGAGPVAAAGLKKPSSSEQLMGPRPPAPYAVTTPTRMTGGVGG